MPACPRCGRENPDAARFCNSCGAQLAAEEPAGVRKTVTVLFCDLVGSTSLGDRADPELLRELMARYHAELRTLLERHGGTVEKFVGDAAMAVFGIPQAHEDDALRAVRAADEIRHAVARLGLEVRIGLNTGEVVAGRGETLVTGDAVNVAARLEQTADAGEIVLGAGTHAFVRDAVQAEPVEPLVLKGKAEPVPAYRLMRLLPDVPAFARPIETPFVGRGDALEALQRALARAIDERSPQLATIVGPPGIGKSRLARELIAASDARYFVGRCLSYGEGITYWPLAEVVAQVGDVGTALRADGDAELAAARIEAALGTAGTAASPEEIAWGFRRLFEELARERPLIVVLDDIHWAEPTLLDLVEYLSTFARDAPLLLLCMARPDLFELRPGWATPKTNATLVTLEPLTERETERLVEALRDVADESKSRIVEAAEGNPLFVEQLVAMQADSNDGEVEIPPTIQALLAARIDRLGPEERSVVERASVEGRLFHRGSVAALLPEQERAGVGGHLLTLVRKEFIRPDRSLFPGDDGFRFGHILIRDAAYDSIPKRLRAELHERFADWLAAKLGDDASDEILGYHLEQAYRYGVELGSADASLGARAAERLAAAARAALMRQDVAATVNLLGRAVELVPDGDVRPELLVDLGAALQEAGELAPAERALEEGVELAHAAGDAHAEWLGRIVLALVHSAQEPEGAAGDLLREAEAAIAAGEATGDQEVLARAWELASQAYLWGGQMVARALALERALPHARLAGDSQLEARLVLTKAPYFIWGPGLVEEGLRYADEALASLGHVSGVQEFVLHVRAHMRARLGEFEGAFEDVTEFRRRLRELGREREYAVTSGCLWDVCLWAGEWQRGEEALREGYETLERMGNKAALSEIVLGLGECLFRQGAVDEAERLSEIGEEVTATDDLFGMAQWLTLRSRVRAARGDLAGAETVARKAIDLPIRDEFPEFAAEARLALAEALHSAGRDDAYELGAEALELYERKGNIVGAARVRAFLDTVPTLGG